MWQAQSASYDRRFDAVLGGALSEAWGFERAPERELRLLGPVRGRDVLELGCGAARWSASLARRGARTVGLDFSSAQLAKARSVIAATHSRVNLVEASAERLPFRDARFDLVFCDWGAMTFCDPFRTVPEVARVLRDGGRFVFATGHPVAALAWNRRGDRLSSRLQRPYFGLHRLAFPGEVNFQIPFGEWVRLFRSQGLEVERFVEPVMGQRARSAYLTGAETRWGRNWPLEAIWALRRSPRV